ncbi:MAG: xanthine dehydrogenase accessory protein XdhC [Pseudomonadota bacterium]
MIRWFEAVKECEEQHQPYCLATVLTTSGSTPRNGDAKMVITQDVTFDTIGGGQLEQLVIEAGRGALSNGTGGKRIEHFPLAASADQCCGGSVSVLLEAVVPDPLRVTLYGAGHVGQALAHQLRLLYADFEWVDPRHEIAGPPEGYTITDPQVHARHLPADRHALVMTHEHQLDYDLVATLLNRGHVSIGLIGSDTKWQRFRARLQRDGFSAAQLARVRCPIGIDHIERKDPPAIAIAIIAELLQLQSLSPEPGLTWRQVRSSLIRDANFSRGAS